MKLRSLIYCLIAVMLVTTRSSAQANVNESLETAFLYVDGVSGSDSNPGTQDKPLQTIAAAAAIAVENNHAGLGTKVTINPGTYREKIDLAYSPGDTSLPITFEAASTGSAIVSGGTIYENWTPYSGNSGIYTHAWSPNATPCEQLTTCPFQQDIVMRREMVVVNGTSLTQVLSFGQVMEGTYYADDAAGVIYLWPYSGTDMGAATVEVASSSPLFRITDKSNIVVRGLTFQYANTCRHKAAVAVLGNSSNILIDSDYFLWNNGQGFAINNPASYFTVMHSVAKHNGDSGFHAVETNHGLWQDNTASYNNWRGAQGGYYGCNVSGAHFFGAHNDTLDGITTTFNQTNGIHWDSDHINITARNINASYNLINGLYSERNQGPLSVSDSYICNQNSGLGAGGFTLRGADKVTISNSVLMNNSGAEIIVIGKLGGLSVTNWETGQTSTVLTQNLTMNGNVIEGNDSDQRVFKDGYLNGADWTSFRSTLNASDNTWWNAFNTVTPFKIPEGDTDTDFAGWQAATGQDANSHFQEPANTPGASCTLSPDYTDYWLTADNHELDIGSSGEAVFNLGVIPLNFSGAVNLTVDGASEVPGLSAELSANSVITSGSSVLTTRAGSGTAAGTYPITVLGTAGGMTRAVTVQVNVLSDLAFSTLSLDFPGQSIGTSSVAQTVTLTNVGAAALVIGSISASSPFAQTNTCGSSLAVKASCTISVTFTPTVSGTQSGTISISHSGVRSPQTVALSGTGVSGSPSVMLTPGSLTFATQVIRTSSAAQSVTLTNSGAATLAITSIALAGANPGDYSLTNPCPAALTAGSTCTLSVSFAPLAKDKRSASISLIDDAAGSPHTVAISGTGTILQLVPGSLTFANQEVGTTSASQTVTLTNVSTSNSISGIGITMAGEHPADFSQSNTCGKTLPLGSSCALTVSFTPTATGSRSASVSLADSAGGSPQTVALDGTGGTPAVNLDPGSLTFSTQLVRTTSAVQSVALTNTGTAPLTIDSISMTGANPADFGQTNDCGAKVAVGATCTVSVTFTPSAKNSRSATISIADDAGGSPHIVALNGTGTVVQLSPASVAFGSQAVGSTSNPQTITLTNVSTTNSITGVGVSLLGTNPGDFTQSNTCGSSVAAGASCSITVSFTPKASGSRSASVSIANSGGGSPQTVGLSGDGITEVPGVSLTPASLTFSTQVIYTSSAVQNATLTNSGTGALHITSITLTGANSADFSQTNTCGSTLAAGASCSVSVAFTPLAKAARLATISVTDDAAGSPHTISLTGTGTIVQLSPGSLNFGSQRLGASSPPQTVILSNKSTSNSISGIFFSLTSANPGDFAQSNDCGKTVAVGASCTVTVTFTPAASGSRSASISIADSGGGSPQLVSLSGTGDAGSPAVTLVPASLTFATQVINTSSPVQNITLTNSGTAGLNITSLAVTGTNSLEFSQTNTCGTNLSAGASCSISVTFTPTSKDTRTANISVTDDAAGSPHLVALTGTGTIVQLSASSVTFGNQVVGTTSSSRTVTLTNKSTTLALTGIAAVLRGLNPADFLQSNDCGTTLTAGAACSITVSFKPTVTGARSAVVSITDSGGGSPQTISLKGNGT